MLDLFKEFAVNLDAEVNGRWVDFMGVKFLIARINNTEYNKQVVELLNRHKDDKLEDDPQLFNNELARIMSKTILLGWEGKVGFKGKELKYSHENAYKLLSDPAMRDFRDFISEEASKAEAYKLKLEDEQEKN
ncbi:hypothetical protein [Oligella urethralis]|uniref:Uncharacterized protein n=1 Tax=Oligella urethralis TaxID=90245 RepID=A0A2X1WMS4_9BURK|nr:hypothetical protein [Oligella urethralis]SPY08025.1 Uncharacterised protein [Oligella urethralis]